MKTFDSFEGLALHLVAQQASLDIALGHGLERVMKGIEKTAIKEFGEYQDAVGPFPAWAELAESTKDDRVQQGYSADEPLLRSGELRDSSGHEVQGLEGLAGSTDPKMVYHEFGTSTIPPRPVWGPAAYRNRENIEKIIGAAAVNGLVGEDVIHPALGYGFRTED